MKFLPYERCSVEVPLSPAEVRAALAAVVEPKKYWRIGAQHTVFEGAVADRAFRIQRIIGYRNSFLPWIEGRLEESSSSARVRITFSIGPVMSVLVIGWFGFLVMLELGVVISTLGGQAPWWMAFIGLGFTLFGYGLVSVCFWPEVARAKEELKRAWGGAALCAVS